MVQTIVVTGGAGFVGSNLAIRLKEAKKNCQVIAFDNLKRRGSELSLPRLKQSGVEFEHGDIRAVEDLASLPKFDLLIDCAAEPSVQSGQHGSPVGVLQNNLVGTINCLEASRTRNAAFLFLSTSRIFPVRAINELPVVEKSTRFEWKLTGEEIGVSDLGIAESFPLSGARSFYGTTKLACENLITEYVHAYGMKALINRCGVIAGPWQMGKVDQGVVTLWVARHLFEKPLTYMGFGGTGKQVRDILHIDDLVSLVLTQIQQIENWKGQAYNVGGGTRGSVSLAELTELCASATGKKIPFSSVPETNPVDIRIYMTDNSAIEQAYNWTPQHTPADVVEDISNWLMTNRDDLAGVFNT